MNRTPPAKVIRALRKEVGFVCPVEGCQNPYLTWHHFDPPWNIREHHNEKGMVALCQVHHNQADAKTFTKKQLKFLKTKYKNRNKLAAGRFNWLRNELMIVAGSNFHYKTEGSIISINGNTLISNTRDPNRNLLLNVAFFTKSKDPRAVMHNNVWYGFGSPKDVECPPSGKKIKIQYDGGDMLGIEFNEISTGKEFKKKYPLSPELLHEAFNKEVIFPLTTVELTMKVGGTNFDLRPNKFDGFNIKNSFLMNSPLNINTK